MANTSDKRRTFITWLLVTGFLLQPVLTYLVTPTVVQTHEGVRVAICTLKGTQTDAFMDLPAIDENKNPSDGCPAIQLVQLAGMAQLPEIPTAPSRVLYSVGLLQQTAGHAHYRLHFSAYSSRAPPLA